MLTCAFGSPWGPRGCGPCTGCLAESDRLEAEFARKVAAGVYDVDGYTPADRRAQAKRQVAA
jgi:hypothetical protein